MYTLRSPETFPLLLLTPLHDFRRTLVISVLFGLVGADRFYERKFITGTLKLLTAGGLGVWWVVDVITLLTGHATCRDGRAFSGRTRHRVVAAILAAAFFASLVPAAVGTLTPPVTVAVDAIQAASASKPVRAPAWGQVTELTYSVSPSVFTVTGEHVRFRYNFAQPAIAYLQSVGGPATPPRLLLELKQAPSRGVEEILLNPGRYQIFVRTEGTSWDVKVEDFAVRG